LTGTAQNILKTLGYFDLFQYPLTKEEICVFHAELIPCNEIETALGELVIDRTIFKLDEFYSLKNDHSLVQRRRKGNMLAAQQMKTAAKVARFLSAFPYVKGIAVSGSLSKNFANEKSDIDLFVVTEANRLWIARTFMHLYKKITFITGRQNRYCMNYYVDEAGLEIKEKNIFTAMEIVTLRPMQGRTGLDDFMTGNDWIKKYFPAKPVAIGDIGEIRPGLLRRGIEKILNSRAGDKLDTWLMNITRKRWQRKTRNHQLNNRGGCLGMAVDRHFSKPDPKNFQDKVVEQYRVKLQQLLQVKTKMEPSVL
jgi:predicted nucleotidyltransferase